MRVSREQLEFYRNIIDRYRLATGKKTYELRDVYDWADARDELELSPDDIRHVHMERLSEACRTDQTTDAKGRRVRCRHCVHVDDTDQDGKPVQRVLWGDVDQADRPFLIQVFTQQRDRIRADAFSFQADLEFANESLVRRGQRPIQMSLDLPGSLPLADAGGA